MGSSGPEDNATAGSPGLAEALALAAVDPAKADAYLEQATELARLQTEQLREEQRYDRFHHFSAVTKAAFEAVVALFILAVLAGAGTMVWMAAHDDGLLIEPFSVPQEMAARGLTGQVVAARLLDRLAQMQDATQSNRAASSYANDWGDDIRVQIPETGVSVSQLYTYLSQWLGHQTHISGEVFRTADGKLAVTARVGASASPTVSGKETDLAGLLQQTAESVYAATQPYRYAVYLMNRGRMQDAEAAYQRLIATGSDRDRAWAYIGIENIYLGRGDAARARAALEQALAIYPRFIMSYTNLAGLEGQLQHDEATLKAQARSVALLRDNDEQDIAPSVRRLDLLSQEGILASEVGDFRGELALNRQLEALPEFSGTVENARQQDVVAYASLHDDAGAARSYADMPPTTNAQIRIIRHAVFMLAQLGLDHWRVALAARPEVEADFMLLARQSNFGAQIVDTIHRQFWPNVAYTLALSGDFKAAHKLIDKTPADCIICLRQRGNIDRLEKNWAGADYWFARAAALAPTPPFVWSDWGRMKLRQGRYDEAIAKFALAHEKGPHFADPLEMWGEALIAEKRCDLAVAKFAAAAAEAPNWGRLHLKWGEALLWSGDKAGARAQFVLAGHLFLTPAEQITLARMKGQV